jgi:phosphoribosylformimino-5-aminoimidazole carboxamide ribotide isomerase
VRLFQGDYGQQTVYSDDPVEVALRWEEQGASRLHVVDLDGAKSGTQANLPVIERIAATVGVPVQVGGGIRSVETARALVESGVSRIILGTVAVRQPEVVDETLAALGAQAVIVGIDARGGMVAVNGWTQGSAIAATELARTMAKAGVVRIMYTDVSKDGTLSGPDLDGIRAMARACNAAIIAAGGIASNQHVRQLAALGIEGAVVGKALYTGDITLPEALAAIGRG